MNLTKAIVVVIALLSAEIVSAADQASVLRALGQAEDAFLDSYAAAQEQYKKALADALDESIEVEVFLLDFKVPISEEERMKLRGEEYFFISPYGGTTRVLQKRALSQQEVAELLPAIRATITGETPGRGVVTCHHPSHGLLISAGGRPKLELSISLWCGNFSFPYPFGGAEFRNLTSPDFAALLERYMPIPQSERDRYEGIIWGHLKKTKRQKEGEPGATDNPDDEQRLREDH